MIQNKKRIISLILMLTLLVSALVVGAVSASAAGEETIKYTISSYPAGTQYKAETHQLDDYLTVITNTRCHFTTELRIYAPSGSVNGEVVLSATRDMTTIVLNVGNNTSQLTVSTSPDNSTWTQHSTLSVVSSYKDLTISNLPDGTRYVKLVNGNSQVRVKYITVTYAAESDTSACAHDNTFTETVEATCTTAGFTTVTCDSCGEVVETETIEALGHDFDRTASGNGRCKNCTFVAPKATFVFAEGENNVIYATNKESHVKAPAVSALTGSYAKEYTFVGWAKMESGIDGETTTAPTLYQPEKYIPLSEDAVFYAVYTYQVVDGNASSEYVLTDLTDIGEDDVVVITMTKGNGVFALPNDKGTDGSPSVVEVDASNNKLSGAVAENILWNIVNTDDGYIIYVNNSTTSWLYCNSSNTGVCVGTGQNKSFVLNGNYLQNNGTGRYLGVYNNSDWRCYTTNTGNSNIVGQTVGFYVKSTGVTTYYVTSLECDHDWSNATCIAPKTCEICGATEGNALGHLWDNDCDTTCNRGCGETRTITHDWADATCTAPKTCGTCGATDGDPVHGTITHLEFKEATCTENGNIEYWYCETCGQAWLNEACTFNTNLLAVVLPMTNHLDDCPHKAVVGDTYYETLEDAINNVPAGTEILLNGDVEISGELAIENAVKINLNGYTITADVVFTFCDETEFIGEGKLVVDKDDLHDIKGETEYIPVWNEDGYYTFSKVKDQVKEVKDEEGNEYVVFRPAFENGDIKGEFADGAVDNGISFVVSITWEGLETPKEYTVDSYVAEVYSEGKAIQLGFENWQQDVEYTVTLKIVSGGLYYETVLCTMVNGDITVSAPAAE